MANELRLGNLEARRDWGFAGDYVEAMWLMLPQDLPDDNVIAIGEIHSVRELLEIAFSAVGLNWKEYVVVDRTLLPPPRSSCSKATTARQEHISGGSRKSPSKN